MQAVSIDYLANRMSIADLINGWMRRDLAQWDALRELFHPDGVIEITWFEGPFNKFVDASMRMGASDLRTKHFIGAPAVTFQGDKALVETNAMIVAENVELGLGCESHNRFFDRVEKRNGEWKIVRRESIYDMGSFDIDQELVAKHPREYAPLAYLLEKSGFPVQRVFATKDSDAEKALKAAGKDWLES
jgi:hypothetical protein